MNFISSRRPLFWVALCSLSVAGIIFTYQFFSRAFPIASLDLKVDRQNVLAQARDLAQRYQWGPTDYREAASFEDDSETQIYVELEAGGADAFNQMITGTLYSPYNWRVRHFRESEVNELVVDFKPDGTPYEFVEKIAEAAPGGKLLPVQARQLAEEAAIKDWHVAMSEYAIIESSQEVRPNGRVDHTFVYERPAIFIGEGRYRLRLTVTGNKLTELNHLVKLPEGFFLRYQEMRSSNSTISTAARVAINILYLFFGCCLGLFLLMRLGWALWQKAALWATVIVFLQFLSTYNELPLSWMEYNTAMSAQNFLLNYGVRAILNAIMTFIMLFLSFAAAESLTRRAFGDQLQLWKLWSAPVASSLPVLGRTLGGYLIVGFDLALIVGTYLVTRTFFGWWIPSDTLINPNILATYLPWLSPSVRALSAGFWEECLFRAVPLASAALIGQRFGKRGLFLVLGFFLQIIVFGAAHADYPTQPSYGRLLELVLPSSMFGGIYLLYGLLPGIISHFIYDLVLMAMPLFISSAPGAWKNQVTVVLWGALPLLILLYYRLKVGVWRSTVEDAAYNRAWQPAPAEVETSSPVTVSPFSRSKKHVYFLTGLSVAALGSWAVTTQFKQDAPAFTATRTQAIAIARQALAEKNLGSSWRALPNVFETVDPNNRYVWQEEGKEVYQKLTAAYYVPTPQWMVRFAQFEGELEARAEEYMVFVAHDGTVLRITHRVPEKQPGASLSEGQARELAVAEINKKFSIPQEQLKDISAAPTQHPARVDWEFVFATPSNYAFKDGNGQTRISVTVSGNEVTDLRRFVHVPEQWERDDLNTQTVLNLVRLFATYLLMFLVGGVALYLLITFNFPVRRALGLVGFLLLCGIITFFNSLPLLTAAFATSEPWMHQLFKVFSSTFMYTVTISSAIALIIGNLRHQKNQFPVSHGAFIAALTVGALFGAFSSGAKLLRPSLAPTWASFNNAGTYVPVIDVAVDLVALFLFQVAVLLALFLVVKLVSANRTRHAFASSVIIILAGLLISSGNVDSVAVWLMKGTAIGLILALFYRTLFSYFPSLCIITLAAALNLHTLQQLLFAAYPGAVVGNVLGVCTVTLLAWYLYKKS